MTLHPTVPNPYTLLSLLPRMPSSAKKKAQIYKEEVRYPGFVLKKGSRFQTLIVSYILMALA